MRKFIVLAIIVLLIAFSACCAPVVNLAIESADKPTEEPTEKPTEKLMEKPTEKPTPEPLPNKVAVVVTKIFYHEDEYNTMVDSLLDAGFEVVVVGELVGTAAGFNETTTVEKEYEQMDAQKLLGIVLIGGDGFMSLWENTALHSLLFEVDALGRVVAAIGTASPTLAIAGVITEGESACWFSGIHEVSRIMALLIQKD